MDTHAIMESGNFSLLSPEAQVKQLWDFHASQDLERVVKETLGVVQKPKPSTLQKWGRRATMCSGAAFSVTAKIFFIPTSLEAPPPWNIIGATCNSAAFVILELYMLNLITKEMFEPISQERVQVIRQSNKGCRSIVTVPTAFVMALMSQVPVALIAYNYNTDSWKEAAFVATVLAGSLFPTYSMMGTFSALCSRSEKHARLDLVNRVKGKLAGWVGNFRAHFLRMSIEEKNAVVQQIKAVRNLDNYENNFSAYMEICTQDMPPVTSGMRGIKKCGEKGVDAISIATIAALHFALFGYTYSVINDATDSTPFAIAAGSLSAGSYFYQSRLSIMHTSRRIYGSVWNFFTGKNQPSLAEQIYPKMSFTLKSAGVLVDCFALIPMIRVWGKFYSNNPGLQEGMQTAICSSVLMIILTAMLDTVDDMVKTVATRQEGSVGADWLRLDNELQEIQELIEVIPEKYLGHFVPPALRGRLESSLVDVKEVSGSSQQIEMRPSNLGDIGV